jgi:hypothetical protein
MTDSRSVKDSEEMVFEERDTALGGILREWQAPAVPDALDARILASYRQAAKLEPRWRRFFTMSIRVPLPVAVALAVLLFVSVLLAVRRTEVVKPAGPQYAGSGSIQSARVEPPVVIRTSLMGFEPVSEMNVSVMPEQER